MNIEKELQKRSDSKCELCGSTDGLSVYEVPPNIDATVDNCILLCSNCNTQVNDADAIVTNHWHCLNDSMWSTVPAVQVMAYRMLNRLINESWAQGMLDMLYLDEETLKWAQATGEGTDQDDVQKHMDSNGIELFAGDTVVLIKDLNVKGSSIVAKRGTAVRGISLDHENPEYIEGKVNGQTIVIITKFVKKTN